jgi:threonine dehydrogenase-like Zn-dependent dehydrogenase
MPGGVRVEDLPEPTIQAPTDAIIRLAAARVCGSDLWPYRGSDEVSEPKPTVYKYVGVVEQVESIKVGDLVVRRLAVLAAKELGAERIIAMSRHADRQALAREFGAIDIVEKRGDAGIAKVKELTDGFGGALRRGGGWYPGVDDAGHRATRPGGHVGFVGVSPRRHGPTAGDQGPAPTLIPAHSFIERLDDESDL